MGRWMNWESVLLADFFLFLGLFGLPGTKNVPGGVGADACTGVGVGVGVSSSLRWRSLSWSVTLLAEGGSWKSGLSSLLNNADGPYVSPLV